MTVATLAASKRQHTAWLLVVEGWPDMFTDRQDLAGSGASSWIGTAHGARVVKAGLRVPDSLEDALVLDGGQAGLLEQSSATFEVVDIDGTMRLLAAPTDDEPVLLGERLAPTDDPAPNNILVAIGGDPVTLWSRYVNGEAIGPAGERRYWGGIPGATTPGPDHAAVSNLTGHLAAVEVTTLPRWREGQRVYLYLLRRDPHGIDTTERNNWPSWQDQYDSEEALVWWGTLRKGGSKGRLWSLPCRGRGSFLQRLLNTNCPAEWSRLDTQNLSLDTGENLIGIALQSVDNTTNAISEYGVSLFDAALDDLPTTGTPAEFRAALGTRLATMVTTAGPDGDFDAGGFDASFDDDGAHVTVLDPSGPPYYGARVFIWAHEKIWRYMGYDPIAQAATGVVNDETQIYFIEQKAWIEINGDQAPGMPAKGPWYLAVFTTKKLGSHVNYFNLEPGDEVTNEGATRTFRPLTPGGVLILKPDAGQEVGDGLGVDARYIEGQLARPFANYEMNLASPCDQTRFFLFRGSRRMAVDEDPVDFHAVAKVSWANDGGFFTTDPQTSQREFYIERWLDPRYYGYPERTLDFDWASAAEGKDGAIEYVPLAVLAWSTEGIDDPINPQRANTIVTRLLVSSGTSAWTGYEGESAAQTAGDNGFTAAADPCGDDFEIADLGLCIPHELVDDASIAAVADNLPPGGTDSPLNRVRYAWVGPRQAEEVLGDLLTPRAWSFSLHGNRYGLFALSDLLTEEDVDVEIGTSDIAVDDGVRLYVPEVDFRPMPPIDRIAIEYGHRAGDGENTGTANDVARDPGIRARAGTHELKHSGRGLVNAALWTALGDPTPAPWLSAWPVLWGWTMANWSASALMMVRDLPIAPPKALQVQVGSVVSITNPWPPSTTGGYGLTNVVGRVVRRTLETKSLRARVDVLLQPGDASLVRRWAPAAMVVDDADTLEERYDAATRTFSCYGDYFGRGDGTSDVAAFAEPDDWTVGGDALIYGWQYNGTAWTQTFSALVSSVDTTAHTITITAAGITGTFYNRMRTMFVMAPYDSQTAAWVKLRFLVVTKATGKFGAGSTQGWKLLP